MGEQLSEDDRGPGWRVEAEAAPTKLILLRHGVTNQTVAKVFSGTGGADPDLNAIGIDQAGLAGRWLRRHSNVEAIVSSPMRRTLQTANIVGEQLALPVNNDARLTETAFGDWDGLSFAQVMERWPDHIASWLESTHIEPPGGESFDHVAERTQRALADLLNQYRGRTVVAVTHVTPVKLLVQAALGAHISVIHRMELAPASISVINYYADGIPSLESFSIQPHQVVSVQDH